LWRFSTGKGNTAVLYFKSEYLFKQSNALIVEKKNTRKITIFVRIPGIEAIPASVILAECGDLRRFQ
jgi:hypothetical protein